MEERLKSNIIVKQNGKLIKLNVLNFQDHFRRKLCHFDNNNETEF
jgi:hypothetical protein